MTRFQGLVRGLPVRIMVLLTLALLPLGYLGVIQTTTLANTAESRLRLSLIGATETILQPEINLLERALGAAEVLASLTVQLEGESDLCRRTISGFLSRTPDYSFAGFLETDGMMRCSSLPEPLDFTNDPELDSLMQVPRAVIRPELKSVMNQRSIAAVFSPVFNEDGQLRGYIALHVPDTTLIMSASARQKEQPVALLLQTTDNLIIRYEGQATEQPHLIRTLSQGVTRPTTYDVGASDGTPHVVVVMPMIQDQIYAAALWPRHPSGQMLFGRTLPAPLFPVLMWLASLAVAYLAIHRLVVRHVQRLGRQMQVFGRDRTIPKPLEDPAIPAEIRGLEATFQGMALDLISEEARMEDALREKNILIKEVHHRVKNNLQLISSIMNLQMRHTDSEEARTILTHLQDRVRGLATVYGYLYQAEGIKRTSAAQLLTDVFGQILSAEVLDPQGVTLQQSFDDAPLTADQAVPLALLASELGTDALKSVLAMPDRPQRIDLAFKLIANGKAQLSCAYSLAIDATKETNSQPATLGNKLMQAFAQQLNATTTLDDLDGSRSIAIAFDLQDFEFQNRNY